MCFIRVTYVRHNYKSFDRVTFIAQNQQRTNIGNFMASSL